MFGRFAARVLVIVLFLAASGLMALPQAAAADPVVENVVSFADVPDSAMFSKEITWLAAKGISTGWDIGDGKREYRPLNGIARDAMAAFLYRQAGSPAFAAPGVSPFADVPVSAAFYKEITWLAAKGISAGWDIGGGKREYRPLSPIARDAMAAFLYRYAQSPQFTAPVQSPFADVTVSAAFYREITWLASSGISTGWDVGGGLREYRPLNGIARDAMAAFLFRFAAPKAPADPQNPAAGTVTVAPDVDILGPTQLDSASVSAGTVSLPSDKAQGIHPGDVLVSGVTQGTPGGLLARVVQVVRDPSGNAVVTTKPATVAEAVVSTSGVLDVAGTPAWSTFTPEPDVTAAESPAVKNPMLVSPAAQAEADIFSKSFSWKKTLKAEVGSQVLSGSGSVSVESSVTAAAKARMTLETGFLSLKEASVVLTPSLTAQHSLSAGGGLKGTINAKLGELAAGFTFLVGPVPVVITAQLNVAANLSVDGTAEISYVSSQTVSSDYGFKYRDGNFTLINTKPNDTGVQNEVKATASLTAKLSLDFDATIKLYGVAGITFGAGPYASAAIAVTSGNGPPTWSCPLELGVESRLGVVAGIEIMGFALGQWTDTTKITWKLLTNDPCEGTPVIPPSGPAPSPTPTPTPTPSPTGTAGLTGITSIVGGNDNTYALRSDGTVWAWGSNMYGQLGDGTTSSRAVPGPVAGLANVTSIQVADATAYALRADGTVWAWGANNWGQLGNGSTNDSATPVQVSALANVVQITTDGGAGAFALLNDGSVWAWGANIYGQMGDGSSSFSARRTRPAPVPGVTAAQIVGGAGGSIYAIQTDGKVWAWGDNTYGQLGDGTTTGRMTPGQINGISNVGHLDVGGGGSVFATLNDGTVWAWGDNTYGEIGDGTTSQRLLPVPLAFLTGARIAAGDTSTLAVRQDGTCLSWGNNDQGQLGDGTTTSHPAPAAVPGLSPPVFVFAGHRDAFAVEADGTTRAWGLNASGTLGDGTTTNRSVPVTVQAPQ